MNIQYLLARRVQLAFVAAILTLLVVGVFSYRGIVASSEGEKWVGHTHAVLDNLQELQVSMEGMESASRGYILTGDDNYLTSYRDASKRVALYQATLRQLTADHPQQQQRLSAMDALIARKSLFLDHVLRLRQQHDLAAAAAEVGTGLGRLAMAEFHAAARQFQGVEKALLTARNAEAQRSVGRALSCCF